MKKSYIWIIVGCCVLLLILGIVGSIAAYYTIANNSDQIEDVIEDAMEENMEETINTMKDSNNQSKKNEEKNENKTDEEVEDGLIEYHNQIYGMRNDVYDALLNINDSLIDPESATSINNAVKDAEPVLKKYEKFVEENPTSSDRMNKLEKDYLMASWNVVDYTKDLYKNYDDIPTYNSILDEYNTAFDDVENSFQAIIDYMDEFSVLTEEQ